MDDLLTSVAIKSMAKPGVEDLSSIGKVEVAKPVRQGFTAFVSAGPALEGVVTLSDVQ